jgi:hypothetical protein
VERREGRGEEPASQRMQLWQTPGLVGSRLNKDLLSRHAALRAPVCARSSPSARASRTRRRRTRSAGEPCSTWPTKASSTPSRTCCPTTHTMRKLRALHRSPLLEVPIPGAEDTAVALPDKTQL